MEEIKILELFGGIGAIRKAFERQKIPHKIIDYVEIDEYAVKSYNAIFNENFKTQDVSKWDKNIEVDLIMHGSPCTDISVAGKQLGADEGSGTRSSLMYETIRIVNKLKPKYVIWENVKNLISDTHSHNFNKYLKTMEEFGYNNYYKVLNAKDYEIPQNRERIFTVSIRKDIDTKNFWFPDKRPLTKRLKDILEDNVNEKYYISTDTINISNLNINETEFNDENTKPIRLGGLYDTDKDRHQAGSIYDKNGLSPTLDTVCGGNHQPIIVERNSNIITHNIIQQVHIRKYPVNTDKLAHLLNESKKKCNLSNDYIATELGLPVSQVEQYFRTDTYFAIPNPDIWLHLKELLNITTTEFDESIMTFEIKDNNFDSSNRIYDSNGIAPTLDTSDNKKIIEYNGKQVELPAIGASRGRNAEGKHLKNTEEKLTQTLEINTDGISNTLTTFTKDNYVIENCSLDINEINKNAKHQQDLIQDSNGLCRCIPAGTHGSTPHLLKTKVSDNPFKIRKLTPKECWRLMGFDDEDFEKAEKAVSNTQLYKQAGNSIVVNVLEGIINNLFRPDPNAMKHIKQVNLF